MSGVRTLFLVVMVFFLAPVFGHAQFTYQEVLPPVVPSGLVDIVVEADTYTPTFYAGRAEPVPGGPVRLVALVRSGQAGNADRLHYYWIVDGRVINSEDPSNPTIKLLAPNKKEFSVKVRVTTVEGAVVADTNEIVLLSEPMVVFYETNPLRGLNQTAISAILYVTGEEVTVETAPYFIDTLNSPAYMEWSVDGEVVAPSSDNIYQLTLLRSGLGLSPTTIGFYTASKNTPGLTAEGKLTATAGL